MSVGRVLRSVCVLLAVGLLSSSAWALQVGLTFRAHQDIENPALWPNDFHVTGKVCSPGYPPILVAHEDGIFTGFSWTIVPAGDPCWYEFEATWWLPKGTYIPYCELVRIGVLIDIDEKNIIIDVKSWWTRDGVPVGMKAGGLYNDGFYPVLGFNVEDGGRTQFMTLANGMVSDAPAATFGPAPGNGIPVDVLQFDLIAFPEGKFPDFKTLCDGCEQDTWQWIPVASETGKPISPDNPLKMQPDTSTDIVLSGEGKATIRPVEPITIDRGGSLVARQLIGFTNNSGKYEQQWQFEVHESSPEEACCYADGTCEMLQPFTCFVQGGTPMGYKSDCITAKCEVIADPGACCYGDDVLKCEVMDFVKCRDSYKGVWKGAGTDCDDWDGDGLADVCEVIATPQEACCFDGECRMMNAKECEAVGGKPQGVGSVCVGDLDGDGRDETCVAKWIQPPDVDVTGIDIRDTVPVALADDFLCTETNAITRIMVWGSWLNDQYPNGDPGNVGFTVMIREDVPDPDGSGPAYSQPGKILWSRTYRPHSFRYEAYRKDIREGYWEPQRPGSYVFPGDTVCWLYTFDVPAAEAFCQQGSIGKPIVYWLDVQATVPPVPTKYGPFGWKTSAKHWNDDGVWQYRSSSGISVFQELRYPTGHPWVGRSADLAFALETQPCIVTPTE